VCSSDLVKGIIYGEFHPTQGPKIGFQSPEGFVSPETFDAISDYIIPKPQLFSRLITMFLSFLFFFSLLFSLFFFFKKKKGNEHICQFLGCGRDNGINFVVMELLGHNLSQLRKSQPKGTLCPSITGALGLEMLDAIRTLHLMGYVHRDIKPVFLILPFFGPCPVSFSLCG